MAAEVKEMETNKTVKEEKTGQQEENQLLVVFKKPFEFEGEVYKDVDLSGLEDLSARDMIAANKIMERSGTVNVIPEMSLEYACIISAKATGKPVEFFQSLPPKEALKIKNRVTSFLYGED